MDKVPVGWTHKMKKDTNTMINLEVKSNLAKLLATENITIQHNKVSTASFDVKNRVLTLPIFEEQKGDVYDMLIAHECSHALWTPWEQWDGIDNAELRSYVNVLEDTRIDKLIQAKYPGVVKNYENGFDILERKNFFGLKGKDINKDLMIIDKINLRSKSLNRLGFDFNDQDNEWLLKVDQLVTFDDVLALAKEMLAWQKEQVEQMKKLPNFDDLEIAQNYDLADEDDDFDDEDGENGQGNDHDDADEKNDFNNLGDGQGEKDSEEEKEEDENSTNGKGNQNSGDKIEDDDGEPTSFGKGADGSKEQPTLKSITDDAFNNAKQELLDKKASTYHYANMPEANLDSIISYKEYFKIMQNQRGHLKNYSYNDNKYMPFLKEQYKKFENDNKKTVMYLVKEFEMKKSATAYKRASQDKTGVIDPLKLKDYQFSDDIFKRLTIVPDGKNHGMIMLLDWSGSMADTLGNTVDQLLNLVQFCKKVNIPFEVYFFTSERSEKTKKSFNHKDGDWIFENFNLVNCFSHRMTKQEFHLASMYMFHLGKYFSHNYTYTKNWNETAEMYRYNSFGCPNSLYLGNTPLNEALIFMDKVIPLFRKKYNIEKMTFITLTDGGANSMRGYIKDSGQTDVYEDGRRYIGYDGTKVIMHGKKKIVMQHDSLTDKLLKLIKVKNQTNNIGFYILKRVKRWDIENYCEGNWSEREKQYLTLRKEMTKNKAIAINKNGYSKYFLLDGKKMNVENFDLNDAEVKKGTASEFKRAFGKAMQSRLVSRVVLNKFIKEVA